MGVHEKAAMQASTIRLSLPIGNGHTCFSTIRCGQRGGVREIRVVQRGGGRIYARIHERHIPNVEADEIRVGGEKEITQGLHMVLGSWPQVSARNRGE